MENNEYWIVHRKFGYDLAFANPQSDLDAIDGYDMTKVIDFKSYVKLQIENELLIRKLHLALCHLRAGKRWQDRDDCNGSCGDICSDALIEIEELK